jgi:hypothetical protein
VAKTTDLSVRASALTRRYSCDGKGIPGYNVNDCRQVVRPGAASVRFPEGVSYTSDQRTSSGSTSYRTAFDIYVLPVTGRTTPYDTFTVAAQGGPSTAGDDDTGALSAVVEPQAGAPELRSVKLRGDTVGTLSYVPSFGMTDPYSAGDGGITGPVLRWSFGTGDGNSYDVASFDVSHTRYVLP